MTSSRLDAESYLSHLRATGRNVAPLEDRVVLALHPAARPRRAKQLDGPFAHAERDKAGVVTISPLGPGAAVAAITIELLSAMGVREVLAIGVGGAIGTPVMHDVSSTIIVESASGDDGVSSRYGGHTSADPDLCRALAAEVGGVCGRSFSTSVPFRVDTCAAVASGALVIEMEAAALFAASAAVGIKVGLAVVVSDVTSDQGWCPGDPDVIGSAVRTVAGACRSIISEIQP